MPGYIHDVVWSSKSDKNSNFFQSSSPTNRDLILLIRKNYLKFQKRLKLGYQIIVC